MHCIALVFKKGHRENLLVFSCETLQTCLKLTTQANQTIVRKMYTKIFQRIGMALLPPKIASWRYQRGFRSLQLNLTGVLALASDGSSESTTECEIDDCNVVVPELEDIIDMLLVSLKDRDTIVRWSAAKGIGRMCMRLSKEHADEVVEAVLSNFQDPDDDGAWHGGCLALAELSRRGLLLPERLEAVVPIIREAVEYDVLRGHHSVGSHVRDAACYVCWAFARAYSPDIMKKYIADLTSSMLLTALFDREVNCRRAASAAFQENVGRQGNSNFKFGIEISTLADYFSLGNRFNSFTKVARSVAALDDEYLSSFFECLCSKKVFHWDEEIRSLAAQSMSHLVTLNNQKGLDAITYLIPLCCSSSFSQRHGALLGLASLVLSVSHYSILSDELVAKVVDIIPSLDRARLFRGRGGELLRKTSCLLIENIVKSNFNIPVKHQVTLVEFLNENLRQPHEGIQEAAVQALRCFLHTYFPIKTEPSQRLQALTTLKYLEGLRTEQNAAVTRGYALALGALPPKLILSPEGRFTAVLEELENATKTSRLVGGEPDIETRRNALCSLIEIVEKMRPYIGNIIRSTVYSWIFRILFDASDDYTVDKRGDTGSWCRKVAIDGMERLVYSAFTPVPSYTSIFPNCIIPATSSIGHQVYCCYGVGIIDSFDPSAQYFKVRFPDRSLGSRIQKELCGAFHVSSLYSLSFPKNETRVIGVVLQEALTSDLQTTELDLDGVAVITTVFNLEESFMRKILMIILQQIAEKLDSIREYAGELFERFISSIGGYKENISELSLLESSLLHRTNNKLFLWANPVHVFPFLALILPSNIYFYSLLLGWVVSMGGLTEALVKESSAALVGHCRLMASSDDTEFLKKLCSTLLLIHTNNKAKDRVVVPLLKSLEIIFRSGCISPFMKANSIIVHDFIIIVRHQISGANDFIKIRVAVDVLCLIYEVADLVDQEAIVKQLVVLTGHKFPRIRKYAAEQVYLFIISSKFDFILCKQNSDVRSEKEKDQIVDVLLSTVWDGATSDARSKRGFIYSQLGWSVSTGLREDVQKHGGTRSKEKHQSNDELDSYEHLVREAGY